MKFAVRQLAKSPGFTVVAIVTLALGIGVNTTAFTVLNRLLLQSLPFRDHSTLVQVWTTSLRDGRMSTAPADYFDEKEQNTVFADIGAYQAWRTMSYAEPGKAPIQVGTVYMTDNIFSILGVRPQLGRTPTQEESKKMAFVCLISDWFWREHFNADPNVLGRTIRVNSRPSTVIGVMPPSLDDPILFGNRPGLFYLDPVTHSKTYRAGGWYLVLARMKPDVSLEQAQAGMTVVAKRLAQDHPDTNKDRLLTVVPFPKNNFGDDTAQLTWMTVALTGMVLLIACVNLANLQLVRTTGRSREVAIRLALGSSRRRIIALFLVESLIVSLLGGAAGVGLAVWSNAFVARFLSVDMPVNLRVIAYTFLASLFTALLFGTIPAWLATRADVGENLKASSRGSTSDRSRHWLRQGLVMVELAMALTLLAGAGFFVGGLYRLTHRSLGWEASHVAMGIVSLDQDHFGGDKNRDKVLAFSAQALEALRALPGVEYAALSDGSPSWGARSAPYQIDGQPPPEKGREPQAGFYAVTPGWLDTFGIQLVQGRPFTDADRQNSLPVALVDESMARALWPGESAIGRRFGDLVGNKLVWVEVVGVVKDFRGSFDFYNPSVNANRYLRPWEQVSGNGMVVFFVRTAGPPGPIKESLRKTMGVLLPDLALNYVGTVEEETAGNFSYYAFLRRILVHIGALGLLLSAIGIYGVVANLATERTKEIGIRMALGANSAGILWMFVRNGLILACAGAGLGLVGAFILTTVLGRILPYFPGKDPWVVACAAVVLVMVALLACWIPARRTTKVSPMVALRVE